MAKLAGRRAVITGAARGIGAGIARRFAEEGAALVLVDRLEPELTGTCEELRAAGADVEP
jgi:3-oxoacyl-[acyl-carrier protein] reductase